ncbi:MAG: AbrB/MazE/SpoVT family DNA-binding domain-containing protein [Planctomycetales bacterium]|nr:AbrB/MazE/SpoVT family DNA-binding domain-containing protein [Planctomycetales bacterium]
MEQQDQRVYRSRVDSSGRILLAAELRQRHRLQPGDTVAVIDTPTGLQVKTQEQLVREMQDYFLSLGPQDSVWSEELLAERRSESERD